MAAKLQIPSVDVQLARAPVPSILKQRPGDVEFFQFPRFLHRKFQYFNPSLCNWNGVRWLVTRRRRIDCHPGKNTVTMWKLNQHWVPTSEHPIKFFSTRFDEHYEDPRAMVVAGSLFLSCSTFYTRGSLVGQCFVEVNQIFQAIRIGRLNYGGNAENLMAQVTNEKNWCWFYDDKILPSAWRFVYSPAPMHIVVTPHKDGYSEDRVKGISWDYGLPRGGTPPVLVDDLYWSFFHSSIDISPTPPRRRYYLGAYAFESEPPFAPVYVTPEPLLIGSEEDRREASAPYCVFPCGSMLHPDKTWTVTLGSNDCECARMTISHERLKGDVRPV